ncbi:MAG: hypothetical protein ABIJ21_07760 [Nanoarchaeota archaeon]
MRPAHYVITLFILFFFITACTGGSSSSDSKYYSGYDGVSMKLGPGTAPRLFYYYANIYPGRQNTMTFNVEVANKGSADTYGGVYISGYDPGFIEVTDVYVEKTDSALDCDWDGLFANHNWRAVIACTFLDSNTYVVLGSGRGTLDAFGGQFDVGRIIGSIFPDSVLETKLLGKKLYDWTKNIQLDVDCDTSTPDKQCSIGVDWITSEFDFGAAANGRVSILYFTSLYADIYGNRNFINRNHGKEFLLSADRPTYPGGELTYVPFEAKVVDWPRGLQQTEQTFLFTSCYVYTTYADPQVCIDPYPDTSTRKVCKPKATTFPKGQGAPVAITSIQQENTPQSIFFTINVQNKGKGLIYHPISLHKCDPLNADRVTVKDLNVVFLGDIRLANEAKQFNCQPRNRMIRLDEKGKGTIVCEYPILYDIKSAYQSPLVVSLWYGYSDTIQTKVLMKRGN